MIISMAKVMVATPKFSPEGYLELMARMEIEYGVYFEPTYQCGAR